MTVTFPIRLMSLTVSTLILMMSSSFVAPTAEAKPAQTTQSKQANALPRFVDLEYTIAMCGTKPVGFWEYRYTIFATSDQLNFNAVLKLPNGQSALVTHDVYEFYINHRKSIPASMLAHGETTAYDLVQLHVPYIKNPKWHEIWRIDLTGKVPPHLVQGGNSGDSEDTTQTCPAGTVSCANG